MHMQWTSVRGLEKKGKFSDRVERSLGRADTAWTVQGSAFPGVADECFRCKLGWIVFSTSENHRRGRAETFTVCCGITIGTEGLSSTDRR